MPTFWILNYKEVGERQGGLARKYASQRGGLINWNMASHYLHQPSRLPRLNNDRFLYLLIADPTTIP